MDTLEIRGTVIGAGMPKVIVPVMGTHLDEIVDGARRAAAAGADCIEWRADHYPLVRAGASPETLAWLTKTAHALRAALPQTLLLFTVRTRAQGGLADIDAQGYVDVLECALGSGALDLVDIEVEQGDDIVRALASHAHLHGAHAVASYHYFHETPATAWMADLLIHMHELGADIAKLAVMAHDRQDTLRLLAATDQAATRGAGPLVTMAMGVDGAPSRLLGEAFGSSMTFASLDEASAPGQMTLEQTKAALTALHQALS